MCQVWRHGPKDHHGEDLRLHLLSERRAGHRPARPRHRVQLQPDLPPEPESREEASAEGDRHRSLFLSGLSWYLKAGRSSGNLNLENEAAVVVTVSMLTCQDEMKHQCWFRLSRSECLLRPLPSYFRKVSDHHSRTQEALLHFLQTPAELLL